MSSIFYKKNIQVLSFPDTRYDLIIALPLFYRSFPAASFPDPSSVIPDLIGNPIGCIAIWIPAFAGMT